MNIEKAILNDLDEIMNIYKYAKTLMKETGNPHQWNNTYPSRTLIKQDIIKEQCFVCIDNGQIVGVFTFIIDEDPTYQIIENGKWSSNTNYGTIHRIAASGKVKGIGKACYQFCKSKINYLRADTHNDNKIMQKSLLNNGFKICGTIYVADGSPRIAFDWMRDKL